MITCSWKAQALFVAAELRIADRLADGGKSCEELAAITATHAPALRRLLRALGTIDICQERDDGSFEMTPMGALLASDAAGSLRCWSIWWGGHLWPVWGHLLYSVKTGTSARQLLLGSEGFEHLERDPEAAGIFNRAMIELTRLASARLVEAYDFSALRRIVDIGGGSGELLAAILRANSNASGVLFDMPHAIDAGRRHLQDAGLASRCEFVAGDFFQAAPDSGDAYILKSVLHDWNDDRCRLILENCRRAMSGGARLLLIEEMVPDRLDTSPAHQAIVRSDLTMLVALAARERTEAELQALLASAGFRVARVMPTRSTFCIIEALEADVG